MLTEIPFKRLFVPPPDDQIVTIGWEISNKCNYSCSYCVPELHGGSTPFPESFDPFLKLVDDFRIKSGKRVALDLVGGEPTLWPDLPKFVSACRGRDVLVDMTSNGSRKASWWSEMAPQLNFISLSFHTEFAQRERFEETIDAITQVKSLVAYILALPGEVKKGRELASGWIENNPRLMVMLKPVRKNFGDEFYEYSEEEWQIFRTNSGFCQKGFALAPEVVESRRWLEDENGNTYRFRQIIAERWNYFKGWSCGVGLDNLHVTAEGEIWRGPCREGGSLGNLYSGWVLPEAPVICQKDTCACARGIMSAKHV